MSPAAGAPVDHTSTPSSRHARCYTELSRLHAAFSELLQRAMKRHCGRDWFSAVCPRPVFERVVARKEREMAIDRSADEYQELMSFTHFDDMADIVVGSGGVHKLFCKLAASEDDLIGILDHLERCRRHLSLGHLLSPADEELVLAASAGLQRFTQRTVAPSSDGAGDEGESPPWSRIADAEEAEERVPHSAPATAGDRVVAEEGVADAGVASLPQPITEAILNGDERTVMNALRLEIVELAEELLGGEPGGRPTLWTALRGAGWQEREPLPSGWPRVAHFYSIFASYDAQRETGMDPPALAALVEKHQLPRLLMELRQIFAAIDAS